MAKITQKINYFPTPPNSSQSPADFNIRANAFVAHQATDYVNEVNTWADEANLLRDEVNGIIATIPAGTINDGLVATDKVWSSSKIQNDLNVAKVQNVDKTKSFTVDEVRAMLDFVGTDGGIEHGTGYTKFPDGTSIHYGVGTTDSTGNGSVNFGHHFINTDYSITATVENPGFNNISLRRGEVEKETGRSFFYASNPTSGIAVFFSWQAIGRWK